MTASRFTASRASAPRSSAAARRIWTAAGTPETVQLLRIWDQYDQQSFVLRIQKGSDVFDTGFEEPDVSYPASFNAHIWLADLDADGYPEVYFNGNMNGISMC